MRWLEAIIEHVQAFFEHAEESERDSYRYGDGRKPSLASLIFAWITSEGSWLAVLVGLAIWGIWHFATKGAP